MYSEKDVRAQWSGKCTVYTTSLTHTGIKGVPLNYNS